MSCVLLEHVKHGSMKNMVCYLFTIFTDLSKRKSSGNLSKFYPLQNHRESEFFWHNFFLETQKCKTRTYFSVASSLSKYYSIQWVGLLWREKVNENSYCQSWSGWWYVLIRHSLRLRLTLTRHKDVGDFRAQRGYSGSVFFHLKSQSWTQIVFFFCQLQKLHVQQSCWNFVYKVQRWEQNCRIQVASWTAKAWRKNFWVMLSKEGSKKL